MAKLSGNSLCINVESIYLRGKEHFVRTANGSLSVIVYGDPDKPALITYPDLALNHMSCFQGLFLCPEVATLLLHNFCVYHTSPPVHERKDNNFLDMYSYAPLWTCILRVKSWGEEYDCGWKKLLKLSEMLEGFLDAAMLTIKVQVQVIRAQRIPSTSMCRC